MGPYDLGVRNERGDRWAEWYEASEKAISNTWFRHHPRHRWEWSSLLDQFRNQIDKVTITRRFRNSITQIKTHPGADCDSGYVPIVADIRVKLKKLRRRKREPKAQISLLRNDMIIDSDSVVVENKYGGLEDEATA